MLPEAVQAVQTAVRQIPDLYLLCQVADDIGEAAVRGVLEHSRLIGTGKDQIPPQRLLFCETEVGKTSVVRQLEPKVHIDGQHSTVSIALIIMEFINCIPMHKSSKFLKIKKALHCIAYRN